MIIENNSLHVHEVNLNTTDYASISAAFAVLTTEEQEKAERFVHEKNRRRFVLARSTLRHLLGDYLNKSPSQIDLQYSPTGKPHLCNDLFFNISHSADTAVMGFCKDREVGIDMECLDSRKCFDGTIQRYFTEEEKEALLSEKDEEARRALFLKYWTFKEAYVKATGKGLAELEQATYAIPFFEREFSFKDNDGQHWDASIHQMSRYVVSIVTERKWELGQHAVKTRFR
ncbi:4'-phosphopantetheinyl transferase family protein [Candidatus Latescibacterota bacterium]